MLLTGFGQILRNSNSNSLVSRFGSGNEVIAEGGKTVVTGRVGCGVSDELVTKGGW